MIPNHTKIQPFDQPMQKQIFDIFCTYFAQQLQTDNCFLLADVGQKMSPPLKKLGLTGAKASVFRACPDYFIYGYDTDKLSSGAKGDALAVIGYEIPKRFISHEEFLKKEEANIANKLKKHFRFNEVPVRDVEDFLKKQNVSYTDIYELIQQELADMQLKELSLGEGYPLENFLVIHPPKDVPKNIKNQIIWIVKNLFADKPTAKNTDLGAAFHKFGIHYTDYDYLHLTAFIRSFTDYFSIIPRKTGEEDNVDIVVRIFHHKLQQYDVSELDSTMFEKLAKATEQTNGKKPIDDPHFRNGIFELYQSGSYDILTEKIYMSYGLKHLEDTAIWTIFINAFLKRGIFPKVSEYSLNEWEKAIFPLNLTQLEALWKDQKQMEDFGFSLEEIQALEPLFHREHGKATTVNALALRLATFCPKQSLLPEIMYYISLHQSEKSVREASLRNLSILYLTQHREEELFSLWDKHLPDVTFRAAARVFWACVEQQKTELILPLWEKLPPEIAAHSYVNIYRLMADYLQKLPVAEPEEQAFLQALSQYPQKEILAHLTEVCDVLLHQKNYQALINLLGAMLITYPKRQASQLLGRLHKVLLPHQEAITQALLENHTPTQIKPCAFGEFWMPKNKLYSEWELKRNEVIAYYQAQLQTTSQAEEMFSLVETALAVFPEEEAFIHAHIRLLEEKYITPSQEEPYKEIFAELSEKKDYLAMISLSESGKLARYESENWYREMLLSAYRQYMASAKAIGLQCDLLTGMHHKSKKYLPFLQALSEDLFDLFYWMPDCKLPESISLDMLLEYCKDLVRHAETNSYQHALVIVKLLIQNEQYLSAALVYALTVSSGTVAKDTEQIMRTNLPVLLKKLPHLTETDLNSTDVMLEEVLTTLPLQEIDFCLSIGNNLLALDQFEKNCDAYWEEPSLWNETYSLSKMVMATFGYGEAWKIYAKQTEYKMPLNYVVMLMSMYRFGNRDRQLTTRCIQALDTFQATKPPKNLLDLNYHLLTQQYTSFPYWTAFVSYTNRTKAFAGCDNLLAKQYFSMTISLPKYREIALEILKQASDPASFLQVDNDLDEHVIKQLGVSSLLRLVLHMLQAGTPLSQEQTHTYSLLIDYAKKNAESTKQSTAALWIEEMLKRSASESMQSDYFRVSFRLLESYPKMENIAFTEQADQFPFADHCNLLDRWLEINPHYRNATALYYFYSGLPVVKDENERRLRLRYYSNAVTKMYELTDEKKAAPGSLLRTAKSLLTLYCLNNFYDTTQIQSSASQLAHRYEDKLTSLHEKAELNRFANGLLTLWAVDFPHYFRDCLVLCGITNYWDRFLIELTNSSEYRKLLEQNAVSQYTAVLDYPKLNRRLLQMLIYAKIAAYNHQAAENEQILIEHTDYDTFSDWAKNGTLSQAYFDNLAELFSLSGSELMHATAPFYTLTGESLKSLLEASDLLIWDSMPRPMLSVLLQQACESHAGVLAELVFLMQYPEQIADTLEHLIHENAEQQPDNLLALLTNTAWVEKNGEFYSGYLLALYYHTQSEFETAAKSLPPDDSCPEPYLVKFANLKNAITMQSVLSDTSHFSNLIHLHKLSFMEARPPAFGEQFNDLVIAFISGNRTTNEHAMIQLAQKIYYLILSGESHTDYGGFIMRWGFWEIAACDNYHHRLSLLQELTDHGKLLEEIEEFQTDFLDVFREIFLSLSEKAILTEFELLHTVGQKICKLYEEPALADVLSFLEPVAKDFHAPSETFRTQLNQLVDESIPLKIKYGDNHLVQKCCDVVADYQKQVNTKGVLEIELLNEDGYSSGSVFYTIQNMGSFPIKDLLVSVSVLRGENRLQRDSQKFQELHKGQLLAEEVEIKKFFQHCPPGEKLTVLINVRYNCQEHKNLTMQREFTLISMQEEYEYHQQTGDDFPIHRMELQNIYNKVCHRNLVMLYGTNGTGKTSLLKMLRTRLREDDSKTAATFTVLVTENAGNRLTKDILQDIMTAFCYCKKAETDTSSVYSQLKRFLNRAKVDPEDKESILETYREYLSFETEAKPFTFDNFIDKLNNLNNTFEDFQRDFHIDLTFCLLWDAFETVISSKNVLPEEMNFKSLIDTFKGEKTHIRIVFTGSNKLLEVAEVKNDADSWNIMFRDIGSDACIKVGNLQRSDFDRIMTDPSLLNNGEIHFLKPTLDLLYHFTNGHVSYSKMFVNQALTLLSKREVNRRCIYPSDLKIIDSDDKRIQNEQQVSKNLTAQIFQDITNDFGVISVGYTLADMVSDGNQAVPAAEVQQTAASNYHSLTSEQINRAIEILKARDFIVEEADKYNTPTYRFTSVLYQQHFLHREINIPEDSKQKRPLEDLIQEVKGRSYDEVKQLAEALNWEHKNVNVHIERQYNDQATDQSIGTQNNIQINAQTIATTFNAMLTADPTELKTLFSSLPTISGFLAESKQEELQQLCQKLELQEQIPVDPYDTENAQKLQKEQEVLEEQIAEIVEPAVTELHNTYKSALMLAEETIDQFEPWKILGLESKAEYDVMTYRLKAEFVADLYFAAKLDYLFQIMKEEESVDFSPVTIMYCKLIEKMLKFYHTDIYADKLKSASTQNSLKDRLILFGDLADDNAMTPEERQFVCNKIMIGAFLWPINPYFGNEENRGILSDNDYQLAKKWRLHGAALNKISKTRNDSAHGSSNRRITADRLDALKSCLFPEKELQTIVELSLAHRDGKEILEKLEAENKQMLLLFQEQNKA